VIIYHCQVSGIFLTMPANVPGAAAVAELEPLNCLRNGNFFIFQMYLFKMKTAIEAAPC